MPDMIIEGKTVGARQGETVLTAARAAGFDIPTLCFHPELSPYGSCRLCLVEVSSGGRTKMVASCLYPAADGLVVKVETPRVLRARKIIVELMLARTPRAKPILDLARRYGIASPRFESRDEDCLLCGMCVRACAEIVGAGALGFHDRGTARKAGAPFERRMESCIGCGTCTYVCPTGSIQMEADAVAGFGRISGKDRARCRFARMGFVSYRVCSNHFQCHRCSFDQAVEDSLGTHPAMVARPADSGRVKEIDGFLFSPDCEYGPGHLWTKARDGRVRAGLDDLARRMLQRVDGWATRNLGKTAEAGSPALVARTRAGEIPIALPISGTVEAINPLISLDPDSPCKDPYGRGWLLDVRPAGGPQTRRLAGHEAERWFRAEAARLKAEPGWPDAGAKPVEHMRLAASVMSVPRQPVN